MNSVSRNDVNYVIISLNGAVQSGDRAAKMNEWLYSVTCPEDSTECSDAHQVNMSGWVTFAITLAYFVLPNIINRVCLMHESSISRNVDILR